MSRDLVVKSSIISEKVARYVNEQIVIESDVENRLRKATTELPNGGMISSSDVGALLALLARSVLTKNALEVGTFTGYTAMKVAAVLPTGGRIVCCDINAEWTSLGRSFWRQAELTEKIDLQLAPAKETLLKLLEESGENSFDFAFIDADKTSYDEYYELCMKLVRSGGLIVLDNMLWGGSVADPTAQDASTVAIRALNLKVSKDSRVDCSLLTVGDGLLVARKK